MIKFILSTILLTVVLVLASATNVRADGMPPAPVQKTAPKPKPKPKPVVHQYQPAKAAPVTPTPVYSPPQRVEYQPEPAKPEAELRAYGVIKTKHAFYRQAWIDYDACVAGGGLRLQSRGFHFGAEGLTDCDEEDRDTGKKKKYKKKKYWGHHGSDDDTGFDRIAIYGGWQGHLNSPLVLDISARHEFADNDKDVTRATGLIGYEFLLSERSTLTPYTGVEMLLTDRDSECLDDTVWTLPVGVRAHVPLSHRFSLYGDGSVNFSDDDRQVAVVEVGAEFKFDIGNVPFVLAPSGAWVSRFDDEESSGKYGWYKKYHRYCRGEDCREDDEFFVGKLELRADIAKLF